MQRLQYHYCFTLGEIPPMSEPGTSSMVLRCNKLSKDIKTFYLSQKTSAAKGELQQRGN